MSYLGADKYSSVTSRQSAPRPRNYSAYKDPSKPPAGMNNPQWTEQGWVDADPHSHNMALNGLAGKLDWIALSAKNSAAAAVGKTTRNENALKFMLDQRAFTVDPTYYPKDQLYFAFGGGPALLDQNAIGILIGTEVIVDDMTHVIATLDDAKADEDPAAYEEARSAVMNARSNAQALLNRWKWYEFKGSSGTKNEIDVATDYVKSGVEMERKIVVDAASGAASAAAKSAADFLHIDINSPGMDSITNALKWGVGIVIGIQVLNMLRGK